MFGLPGEIDRWRLIREEIHNDVCTRGFDAELGSFVQAYGSKQLDASLLLLPAVGFLPPEDARIRRHASRRSSAISWSAGWCAATTPKVPPMACRPAKGCSSPAASGWSMPT